MIVGEIVDRKNLISGEYYLITALNINFCVIAKKGLSKNISFYNVHIFKSLYAFSDSWDGNNLHKAYFLPDFLTCKFEKINIEQNAEYFL